jgi:hypothetical protein
MAPAADLQQLLLMVAYQFALEGSITHGDIPDDPTSESERRQPFFFAAAGLPAFYVHKNSRNKLLKQILPHCKKMRSSWRHPDFLRISIRDYCEALLTWLSQNASATIDQAGAELTIMELRFRLADPALQAHQRVINGVMEESGGRDPMESRARDFNLVAEHHYRETLRRANLHEAFEQLRQDAAKLAKSECPELGAWVRFGVRVQDPVRFLNSIADRMVNETLTAQEVKTVLNLLLLLSTSETEERAQCHV